MGGLPDLIFIIDTNKEHLAINEAKKLDIPVAAVVDSNSDPYGISYPIPGNDDALRAISLYCELVADAVLDGISAEMQATGGDAGAAEEVAEPIPEAEPAKAGADPAEAGAPAADAEGAAASAETGEKAAAESGDKPGDQGGGESAGAEQQQDQAKSA
jgi:small subunit ribosomal protein S2